MDTAQLSQRYCLFVGEHPEMPSHAAKLGAWLIAVADKLKRFPVEVTGREIAEGIDRDGLLVPPLGANRQTIVKGLEWLATNGVIRVQDGRPVPNGRARLIYWNLV